MLKFDFSEYYHFGSAFFANILEYRKTIIIVVVCRWYKYSIYGIFSENNQLTSFPRTC